MFPSSALCSHMCCKFLHNSWPVTGLWAKFCAQSWAWQKNFLLYFWMKFVKSKHQKWIVFDMDYQCKVLKCSSFSRFWNHLFLIYQLNSKCKITDIKKLFLYYYLIPPSFSWSRSCRRTWMKWSVEYLWTLGTTWSRSTVPSLQSAVLVSEPPHKLPSCQPAPWQLWRPVPAPARLGNYYPLPPPPSPPPPLLLVPPPPPRQQLRAKMVGRTDHSPTEQSRTPTLMLMDIR